MRLTLLDWLCREQPAAHREEHLARILCGEVEVDGERVLDPQRPVRPDCRVALRHRPRFVSRGGAKLDGILREWALPVHGLDFIDAGASTGGFTDCLLQRGARRVCAVEAGANQLAYRLRTDPRVTVLERTNLMTLRPALLPFRPDAAVADLSLRSLRGAARRLLELVSRDWLVALAKPQYEIRAASGEPGPAGGVVSEARDRLATLRRLAADLRQEGVYLARVGASPLRGGAGNEEYFFLLARADPGRDIDRELAALVGAGP